MSDETTPLPDEAICWCGHEMAQHYRPDVVYCQECVSCRASAYLTVEQWLSQQRASCQREVDNQHNDGMTRRLYAAREAAYQSVEEYFEHAATLPLPASKAESAPLTPAPTDDYLKWAQGEIVWLERHGAEILATSHADKLADVLRDYVRLAAPASGETPPPWTRAQLEAIANDPALLEIGRRAIEDMLIAWRDSRLSEAFRNNGLVVRAKDGQASSVIRFGPEKALSIGLRAIAQTLPATVPAPVAPLEYDCTTCGAHWVAVLPSRACPECCGLFIKKRDRSAPATIAPCECGHSRARHVDIAEMVLSECLAHGCECSGYKPDPALAHARDQE